MFLTSTTRSLKLLETFKFWVRSYNGVLWTPNLGTRKRGFCMGGPANTFLEVAWDQTDKELVRMGMGE